MVNRLQNKREQTPYILKSVSLYGKMFDRTMGLWQKESSLRNVFQILSFHYAMCSKDFLKLESLVIAEKGN